MNQKLGIFLLVVVLGISAHAMRHGKVQPHPFKRGVEKTMCWENNLGTCYYVDDPCPEDTYDCPWRECPLPTNKCCCRRL